MHAKTRVPSWTTDGVCAAALVYETIILTVLSRLGQGEEIRRDALEDMTRRAMPSRRFDPDFFYASLRALVVVGAVSRRPTWRGTFYCVSLHQSHLAAPKVTS